MTPKKVFSCEFREVFKSNLFKEHIQTTTDNIDDKNVNSNKKNNNKGGDKHLFTKYLKLPNSKQHK